MKRPAKRQLQLTKRDVQIAVMVYQYDGLLIEHLCRRFWANSGAQSHIYDRISRLIDQGYLRGCRLPPADNRGSGPLLLTVGSESHSILMECLDIGRTEL